MTRARTLTTFAQFYFVRGCYITAVDIPLRLIRLSRHDCSYGRRCLVPVVATSPFHTSLCFCVIPTRRPPTRLLLTPFGAVRSPCVGEIWSAADTSTILDVLQQQQNMKVVNCSSCSWRVRTEIASGRVEIMRIEDGRRNKQHVLVSGQLLLIASPRGELNQKHGGDSRRKRKIDHAIATE